MASNPLQHGNGHSLLSGPRSDAIATALMAILILSSATASESRPLFNRSIGQNRSGSLNNANADTGSFDENFYITWGNSLVKFLDNRRAVQLLMDRSSGSGFASRSKYLYGVFSAEIKLVPGDSSGTVTAFYLSTQQNSNHDELDFEFLGNKRRKPHYLNTNVFVNGVGNREIRIKLWFDPTAGFHTYSILWNRNQILFAVDQMPIRVFKNSAGIPYPSSKPMQVIASLWNGEDWATDGGKAKINWKQSPFVASFKGFEVEGHKCEGVPSACPRSSLTSSWWEHLGNGGLSADQMRWLKWVRKNYMTYDYCTDKSRSNKAPPECSVNNV